MCDTLVVCLLSVESTEGKTLVVVVILTFSTFSMIYEMEFNLIQSIWKKDSRTITCMQDWPIV